MKASIFKLPYVFNSQKLICYYFSWVLFVRSFFLKERPFFIFFIYSFYPVVTLIIPTDINLDPFIQMRFLFAIGIYLIAMDFIGSLISSKLLSSNDEYDYIRNFFKEREANTLKGKYLTAGWSAIFVGKTAMTATGRAAMIGAVLSGGVYLYNGHLQRVHETAQASAQQVHEATEAARQRAYANYTYSRDQYDKSYIKKGPKPSWSEDNYTAWKDSGQTQTGSKSK